MTSKELVIRAIKREEPPKIPLYYCNRYIERSDLLFLGYGAAADFQPDVQGKSEWGFVWQSHDDTMGQPKLPPLADGWELFDRYIPPDPDAPGRFESVIKEVQRHPDRYLVGNLGITGFNMVTFLRGFEQVMEDLYLEPERLEQLIKMVFDYESAIIRHYADAGVDAVALFDDWGTQNALMIRPELWRKVFKPHYEKQFALAHKLGLHVFFHSCGQVFDIIPDLIEIGVDMLNLNQPDLFGIEQLGKEYGGKVCFVCPVDHQTVAIHGTKEEIFDYVRRLREHLGCFSGGFIGLLEEYSSVGMTKERFEYIVSAFETLRS